MNRLVSKVMFLFLSVLCLAFAFYPASSDAATYVKANGYNIHRNYDNRNTNVSISGIKALSVGTISSTASNVWPDAISSQATTIPYLWFSLNDDEYQRITGILVDEVKIYQQDTLILSTTDVTSYIESGEYRINNAALQSQFTNSNGDNLVDFILYKDGTEVARIDDYTLKCYTNAIITEVFPGDAGIDRDEFPLEVTILNANESATISAYYSDSNGDTVASLAGENSELRSYDSDTKELYVGLKMTKTSLFDNESEDSYYAHIFVNNIEMSYSDSYYNELWVNADPFVYCTYWMEDDSQYYYDIEGLNLISANPFTLQLEQNGEIISEIQNVYAEFDEDSYWEYIYEDITSEIDDPNTALTVRLFSNGVEIDSFVFVLQESSQESNVTAIVAKIGLVNIIKEIDNIPAGTEDNPRAITVVNGTTVAEMIGALQATDGSSQTYYAFADLAALSSNSTMNTLSTLETGNILKVAAADGVSQAVYLITIKTQTINVFINGQAVTFPNGQPYIENGRTMLPMIPVFEAMGVIVTWNANTQTAVAVKGDTTVVVTAGSVSPTINDVVKTIDVPAIIVNDTLYAPLRFVCEAFGGTCGWNGSTYTVDVVLPAGGGGGSGGGGGGTVAEINPSTASFDKKTSAQVDVTTVMTLNGNTLVSITNGTDTLTAETDYCVNENTVTIKSSYLATKPKGITTLTFNFSNGSTQNLAITISDSTSGTIEECFIATAAFGSKLQPVVVLLRQFRDKCLLTNILGQKFVAFYYRNSPPIAAYIAHSEPLKALVRVLLLPLIAIAYMALHPGFLGLGVCLILILMLYRRKVRNKVVL